MHAIGKGIMILETQQSSDTTYRVYDFDRKDSEGNLRDLHIKESIDVLTIGKPENSVPATMVMDNIVTTTLVSNPFFTVYKWSINQIVSMRQTAPYLLVSVLSGQGHLAVGDKSYPLEKGMHFILPNDVKNWSFEGQLELIVSHPNQK